MDWRAFHQKHRTLLESHYPGLTLERFLREAQEIGGDGEAFLRGEPFAYLLGYAEFYGRKFQVDQRVLIPRPETEQLAEKALAFLQSFRERPRIVDVGTGSGCLGLTVALEHRGGTDMVLTDISPDALTVAKLNALALGAPAETRLADLLEGVDGPFDLVLSNPPYIPSGEKGRSVHPQVDAYEPELALYVNEDAYEIFFRRLFRQVRERLAPGGAFYMEGHEAHLGECAAWARAEGMVSPRVENDFSGSPRFLVCGPV